MSSIIFAIFAARHCGLSLRNPAWNSGNLVTRLLFGNHETLAGGYKCKDVWNISNIIVCNEQNINPANTFATLILALNMLIHRCFKKWMAFYFYGDFYIYSFPPLLNWIRISSGEMQPFSNGCTGKETPLFPSSTAGSHILLPSPAEILSVKSQKISYKDPMKGPHIRRLKSSFIHSESFLHPLLLPPLFLKLHHHGVSVGSRWENWPPVVDIFDSSNIGLKWRLSACESHLYWHWVGYQAD